MKIKSFLRTYYPAFLILVSLIAFSFYAFYESTVSFKTQRAKLFEIRIQRITETVRTRIIDYVQILQGCKAVFYASDSVTAKDWKSYTENLKVSSNYPGIQAIAYARYIPKPESRQVEQSLRKTGFPNFKIRSTFKNNYLSPIIFIEPLDFRNLRALGFDMYSETIRREAMDRAIITGKAALSRKVKLVQETNQNVQPGFLLYLPVYKNNEIIKSVADRKKNIIGFVYNAFRAYDLMNAVLKQFDDVDIEIYDGNTVEEESLLYNSDSVLHAARKYKNYEKDIYADTVINNIGTPWHIHVTTRPNFGSAIEKRQPILVLFFGLAISSLLFMISLGFIKRKKDVDKELVLTKELENKKDEFIGIASHELKTPLTSIKAYFQLLERAELKEKERVFAAKANTQIQKLNNLIADLLDVSKIQSGKLQLNISTFLLKDLIADSVENVGHMFASHEIIKPAIIPDITLKGDKFRLEQALSNFLVNAIKYSPGQDKVFVEVELLKKKVIIKVKDKGIGISKENQKQIFEKFFRAKELSPILSGLGMGLYISSEIIKQHHGEITVQSEVGKGSVFEIILPLE
ncbi:CHASE domain-containing sensor histidine kinase [Rubrolithibacter danxiaensis]|uniref:CHASE domain-containing sensor histidine kinase n=1 Tax=Rubrolithibacter danxiaensis TaxID=3390805 RepID=UPI003BF7D0DD